MNSTDLRLKLFPHNYSIYFYKVISLLKLINFEALVWISGLVYLAIITPGTGSHFTICPLNNLGIDFCPGCGLGQSISYLFHLEFAMSLSVHPLGIPALIVLLSRVAVLTKKSIFAFYQQLIKSKN